MEVQHSNSQGVASLIALFIKSSQWRLERLFSGYEPWLLFQRTLVPFPASTFHFHIWLTTICNSRFRRSHAISNCHRHQPRIWKTDKHLGPAPRLIFLSCQGALMKLYQQGKKQVCLESTKEAIIWMKQWIKALGSQDTSWLHTSILPAITSKQYLRNI